MSNRSLSGPIVIAVASIATLVVYGLIRWLWVVPVAEINGEETVIGWSHVVVVTLIGGFAAWGVSTLLRRTGKAAWWPFVGSTALAISIIGPAYMSDGSSAVALIVLHFVAAIPLILGFARLDAVANGSPAMWRG